MSIRWTGEFRQQGLYRLTVDEQVWELRYRKRSRAEPDGWYLYGPPTADVVAEFMGEKLASAQRAAAKRVATYDPYAAVTVARSAELEKAWDDAVRSMA